MRFSTQDFARRLSEENIEISEPIVDKLTSLDGSVVMHGLTDDEVNASNNICAPLYLDETIFIELFIGGVWCNFMMVNFTIIIVINKKRGEHFIFELFITC